MGTMFQFRKLHNEEVGARFPWHNLYVGRHELVNARLIGGGLDRQEEACWHGHTSASTVPKYYADSVEVQRHVHGEEWLRRACQAQDEPSPTGQVPV